MINTTPQKIIDAITNTGVKEAITKLKTVFEQTTPHLIETDQQFVTNGISRHTELYESGEYLKDRSNVPWEIYNTRSGAKGINGFTHEVCAVGWLNKYSNSLNYDLYIDSTRQDELNGKDMRVFDTTTNSTVYLQVKTTPSLDDQDIKIDNDWVKYKTSNVRFLVLVDCYNEKLVISDYSKFKECVERNENNMYVNVEVLILETEAKIITQEGIQENI